MNHRLSSVFPRPSASDPDDVVWTLQTAAVQWQRGLRADAIVWVRKAADTATQLGHVARAEELRNHAARLAEFLWSDPEDSSEDEETAAIQPRGGGSSRRVLDRDDDADEIIEVEEIEGFDGDFGETDLPTPDDAATDLTAEDLAYYRDDRAAAPVLPDDLDLRSDSERAPARGERDSYMSVSPEDDDDEDSETGRRDSYMSVSPEPDDDSEYMDVSPESASPRPAPRAKISERPTRPRIERPPLVPRIVQRNTEPSSRAPARAASEAPVSAPRAADLGVPRIADLGVPRMADLGVPRMADLGAPRAADPALAARVSDQAALFDPKSLLEVSLPPRAAPVDTTPPAADGESSASVDGIALETVETLGDLPEEAQAELAKKAKLVVLASRQEIVLPEGAVLVTRGTAHVTLPHSDVSAGRVGQGTVVAARGSIEAGPLRLIADTAPTHLVTWSEADVEHATRDCPWVVDDLRLIADRFQAHASAGLGPLGARLDDALRAAVYERLQVRVLSPDESVAERGKPLKGLFVVAVGELRVASGDPGRRIGSGEFVFPSCVIGAEPAPHDVKAGPKGGLVLFATRPVAHELMMSVPPLLEILAS